MNLRRRDFLKAAGTSAALAPFVPFLNRHAEAATTGAGMTADGFPKRLLLIFTGNGTLEDQFWPVGDGANFTFKPGSITEPLAPFAKKLLFPRGLHRKTMGQGAHEQNIGALWTGCGLVSGFGDFPVWHGQIPVQPPYAALVDFYDTNFRDMRVRVAVLLQPVASSTGRGMAVVQVAETLELRRRLTRRILIDFLWQQAALVAVIGLVVVVVVQGATRPVRRLSQQLQARPEGDLTPLAAPGAPRELAPLVDATNEVMARLDHMLDNQKRFVRDTSHQLRTPLAVLKAQVQSALRGDVAPRQALGEISETVDRATVLANQMLALAKVEQLRQQPQPGATDLAEAVRTMALELAPLVADKDIEFDIETRPATVAAHEWMLRELARNLLHNAIKHTPAGGTLSVRVLADRLGTALVVRDSGPGIPAELQARLFQPFSAGDVRSGSGLGLAICQEIVRALGGTIELENEQQHGRVTGLVATVRLPLADNPA